MNIWWTAAFIPLFPPVNDLRKAIEEQLEKDWDAIVEVLDNNPDGLEEMWEESFFSDDPETVLTYLKKRSGKGISCAAGKRLPDRGMFRRAWKPA